MAKQKLTRNRLRRIIREEQQKMNEQQVRGMQGDVSVMARGQGDYLLTVSRAQGSQTAVLSKSQLQDLMDVITAKL